MHFTDKMPHNQPRGHASVEWKGDRLLAIVQQREARDAAIRHGAKHVPPPALDVNFHWWWFDLEDHAKGGEWLAVHYRRPGLVNFRFYLEPGATKARRMTPRELTRTRWTAGQVKRWRRTSDPDSARPTSYLAMALCGHANGIYVCAELKSPEAGGASRLPMRTLVADARTADHPPWGMALLSMKNARGKCENLEHERGQFALIFGRLARAARKPKDWASWSPKPSAIWNGSRRLQAWL